MSESRDYCGVVAASTFVSQEETASLVVGLCRSSNFKLTEGEKEKLQSRAKF